MALAQSIAVNFRWISPYDLYLNARLVARGEVWRLVTSYLYFGTLDIYWLINAYQNFVDLYRLERGNFGGKRADFVAFLLLCWAFALGYALTARTPYPDKIFFSATNYVWCRLNPDYRVTLFGMIMIPTFIWPVVRVGIYWLMGRPLNDLLAGFLIGHFYYFSEEVFPKIHQGVRPLHVVTAWVVGQSSAVWRRVKGRR